MLGPLLSGKGNVVNRLHSVFNQTKRHALLSPSVAFPERISVIGGSARVTRYSIHMASTSRPNPLEEDDDETEEEVRQLLPLPPKLFVLYSWIRIYLFRCNISLTLLLRLPGKGIPPSQFVLFEFLDSIDCFVWFFRFISDIEAICRQWLADGPKNLVVRFAFPNYFTSLKLTMGAYA